MSQYDIFYKREGTIMDFKTIKQPLVVNETVYSQNAELPLDSDFTLPDFCPDIVKILKCSVLARVTSKSISGQNVCVDGHISVNILYCDKNGCVNNYEHILPFDKLFDTGMDISGANIECVIKNEYINSRAVTERKVSVHGALLICVKITLPKKYDVIADIENEKVQIDRKEFPSLNAIGSAEKYFLIEEELALSAGQQSIDSVLRCEANPVISEIKAVRNKASVKGNLTVSVLYSTGGGKQCVVYKSVLPFSQFVDIQGISEDCICTGKAQLCFLEVKPKVTDNECRSMMLSARIALVAETFCDSEIPVIFDAYSTEHELSMKHSKIKIEKVVGHINDTFMFKKSFDFSEGSIGNIIDSWFETEINEYSCEQGKLLVKGSINLCILTFDTESKVAYFEKKADFCYEKNIDFKIDGNLVCAPVMEPVTSSFTILSDSCVEYRVEYRVNLSLREEKSVPVLTDIAYDEKNLKSKNSECSMVLYFAECGEKIWDIAKQYNSDVAQVKEINEITDDIINMPKRLLIPLL